MVSKILVATDGSKASDTALEYAIELTKFYGSELILLNVTRTDVITTYRHMDRDFAREKIMQEREEYGKRVLGKATGRAKRAGVAAEAVVRQGLPDEEIVNLAKGRDDISLLMMGAFGKNFLERQIVGSKTEGVLRKLTELDIPLIIVPHPCKKCESDVLRKVLFATDGSEASLNALEYAAQITKMYGGELLIMNVIRKGLREGLAKLKEDRVGISKKIIDKSILEAKKFDVYAEGVIKEGFVGKEIVKFAKERDDIVLVVMGAYGKNFLERQLVGSKTQEVLRRIPELDVPLAVVPAPLRKETIKVPIT
jgi:nucleotide-binding universal stress UspA family protein